MRRYITLDRALDSMPLPVNMAGTTNGGQSTTAALDRTQRGLQTAATPAQTPSRQKTVAAQGYATAPAGDKSDPYGGADESAVAGSSRSFSAPAGKPTFKAARGKRKFTAPKKAR